MRNDSWFDLDGYQFGKGKDVFVQSLDPGEADWTTQDAENAVADGQRFGRDFLRGPEWTFGCGVDATDAESALTVLREFAKAWRNRAHRQTPGTFSTLRYNVAGRTRRVYGRPRSLTYPPDQTMWQGYIPVTAKFQTVDPLHYADAQQSQSVTLVSTSTGGWVWPAVFPISTIGGGQRQGIIAETGTDVEAPVIVTFNGPIDNPWVECQDWRIELTSTLAYDQSVVIDTRPWVNTVLRNDGASLAGDLTRKSNLRDARLSAGGAELIFGGNDTTRTATCKVTWRPAFETL